MTKNIAPPHAKAFAQQRNSNNELLRIVCMFFIVFHHFLVHAVWPETLEMSESLTSGIALSTITNGFVFIGVNCFLLISGYYGIKLRWRGIIRLFIICATYGLLGYLFHLWRDDVSFGRSVLYNTIFIFSHNNWWYIKCYLILMLLSPLLNAGIENMNKKTHQLVIIGLIVCQVYFGYYWEIGEFDVRGYGAMQFITMYMIGAYIKRYVTLRLERRWLYIGVYAACALLWGFISCLWHKYDLSGWWHPFRYNNPLIIISSIAFFLFFHTFSFYSKSINWIAGGTLAAYLIQDQEYFSTSIYNAVEKLKLSMNLTEKYFFTIGIAILFLIIACVIDKVRQRITNPMLNKYTPS